MRASASLRAKRLPLLHHATAESASNVGDCYSAVSLLLLPSSALLVLSLDVETAAEAVEAAAVALLVSALAAVVSSSLLMAACSDDCPAVPS